MIGAKKKKRQHQRQMTEQEIRSALHLLPETSEQSHWGNTRRQRHHHHHHRKGGNDMKLSWWEEFIVTAAISLLTMLESKLTNPAEIAALQAAVQFLQKLLSGTLAMKPPQP